MWFEGQTENLTECIIRVGSLLWACFGYRCCQIPNGRLSILDHRALDCTYKPSQKLFRIIIENTVSSGGWTWLFLDPATGLSRIIKTNRRIMDAVQEIFAQDALFCFIFLKILVQFHWLILPPFSSTVHR